MKRQRVNVSWTKERIAQLIELWDSGLSLNGVAVELFGSPIYKNAVQGKLIRIYTDNPDALRRPIGARYEKPIIWTDRRIEDFWRMIEPRAGEPSWTDDEIAHFFNIPVSDVRLKKRELLYDMSVAA